MVLEPSALFSSLSHNLMIMLLGMRWDLEASPQPSGPLFLPSNPET